MHLFSIWLLDFGLTLAQVATEEKLDAITAIREALRLVDLKGAIDQDRCHGDSDSDR